MSTIDDLIATAKPRTATVRVFARGDLVDAHARLAEQLHGQLPDSGSLADIGPTREIAEQLVALQEEMEASAVDIIVQTIPDLDWADLLRVHAPSAEDRRAGHDTNPKTFPQAAVAACAVAPTISLTQAEGMRKSLHNAEWNKLYLTVIGLNVTATPLPKMAAASELLRASEPLAKPSGPGSLAPSSSDGSGDLSQPTSSATAVG